MHNCCVHEFSGGGRQGPSFLCLNVKVLWCQVYRWNGFPAHHSFSSDLPSSVRCSNSLNFLLASCKSVGTVDGHPPHWGLHKLLNQLALWTTPKQGSHSERCVNVQSGRLPGEGQHKPSNRCARFRKLKLGLTQLRALPKPGTACLALTDMWETQPLPRLLLVFHLFEQVWDTLWQLNKLGKLCD